MINTKIIDFHSHILPAIDDGSPDVKTSVEMLRLALEQQVDIQVFTPHYYPWQETIESFYQRREESLRKLLEVWKNAAPCFLCGAEAAFFSHMSRENMDMLCIEGTRTLLIELPFQSWNGEIVDEIAALSLDKGFHIVLAHVERYLHYKNNASYLNQMRELPLMLQINAGLFLRPFGGGNALKLVGTGENVLLGSDAHNLTSRRPNILAARRQIEKKLGPDVLRNMDQSALKSLETVIEKG